MSERRRIAIGTRGARNVSLVAAGVLVAIAVAWQRERSDAYRAAWRAWQAGEAEDAIGLLASVAEQPTSSTRQHLLLGRLFEESGRVRDARVQYRWAALTDSAPLRQRAVFEEGRMRFAWTETRVGRFEDPGAETDASVLREARTELASLHADLGEVRADGPWSAEVEAGMEAVESLIADLEGRLARDPDEGEGEGEGSAEGRAEGGEAGEGAMSSEAEATGAVAEWLGGSDTAEARARLEAVLSERRRRERKSAFAAPRSGERGW